LIGIVYNCEVSVKHYITTDFMVCSIFAFH